ncbi:MAG: hypothetical protein KA116_06235 [Proteobacteria bacterium]|nr:hypothetical protein [Pseudomonadota bacterium]
MNEFFRLVGLQITLIIFSNSLLALTNAQRTEAFRQCRSTDSNNNYGDYVAAVVDGIQIRCLKRNGVTFNIEDSNSTGATRPSSSNVDTNPDNPRNSQANNEVSVLDDAVEICRAVFETKGHSSYLQVVGKDGNFYRCNGGGETGKDISVEYRSKAYGYQYKSADQIRNEASTTHGASSATLGISVVGLNQGSCYGINCPTSSNRGYSDEDPYTVGPSSWKPNGRGH